MSKVEVYHSPILERILNKITPEEAEKTRKRMMLAIKIGKGIEDKGWKKKNFAEALHKRPSEITKWLSGTHNFNLDTLLCIEEVLSINLVSVDDVPKKQVFVYQGVNENIRISEGPTSHIGGLMSYPLKQYQGQNSVCTETSSNLCLS